MTRRSELKNHIEILEEIKSIVNALKNLALMEINKIEKFSNLQKHVLDSLSDVAADFFSHHSNLIKPLISDTPKLYVIIGSERGFCANFNDMVFKFWQEKIKSNTGAQVIVVGRKMLTKFEAASHEQSIVKAIDGANSTEEIPGVIYDILQALNAIFNQYPETLHPGTWAIIFNSRTDQGDIKPQILAPFAASLKNLKSPELPNSPLLYMEPHAFLQDFINNYLFAVFLHAFYQSFASENRQRYRHMESALDWIDKKKETMSKQEVKINREEITEAIEIILLSTGAELQQ